MDLKDQDIVSQFEALDAKLSRVADCVALLSRTDADPDRTYTRKETACLLGCSVRTVDRRIRSGDLKVSRSGRRVRVLGRSIQASTGAELKTNARQHARVQIL